MLVLLALLVGFVGACKGKDKAQVPTHRFMVGLAMHYTFDDYAKSFMEAFESVLKPTDVLYEIADADVDGAREAEQIRMFTAKRVDALVVVPIDDRKIVDALNEAAGLGIPTITVTHVPQARVTVTIPGDDRRNGIAAGELMVQRLNGQGDVMVVGKYGLTHRIDERLAGFDQVMARSGIKVVEYLHVPGRAAVIDHTMRVLGERPSVKGIFAMAGFHTESVATALRQMGRKDIVVTSVDAHREVLQFIRDGYVTGAAAQYPWMHGEYAAKIALDVIHGRSPRPIPPTRTMMITAQNVDLGPQLLSHEYARWALAPADARPQP
jgi:ABC-type sugar transport system substrate-binding protein